MPAGTDRGATRGATITRSIRRETARTPRTLRGLRALVTGAASGIGRQLAIDLAAAGAELLLVDRSLEGLAELAPRLAGQAAGRPPQVHACDLASADAIDALVDTLEREKASRPLDLLINNAGIYYAGAFETMALDDFERVVAVNLLGAVRLTRGLLPRLLQSARGCIVNVASVAGLVALPGMCAYASSKFGLVGFSRALRAELAGRVDVCTVCPAFVRTGIARGALQQREIDAAERRRRVAAMDALLARVGASPGRVSRAVLAVVQRPRELTLVSADAWALFALSRWAPGLCDALVSRVYRTLLARGVIAR